MLTAITIFIIALHMAVTFPTGLTTETKLWSLGGFALLALVSLISAFMQEVKRRDMPLLQNMLLMKAIGFMVTFSYAFLEEDAAAMITVIRSQILTAAISTALFFVQSVHDPDAICNCSRVFRYADRQLS